MLTRCCAIYTWHKSGIPACMWSCRKRAGPCLRREPERQRRQAGLCLTTLSFHIERSLPSLRTLSMLSKSVICLACTQPVGSNIEVHCTRPVFCFVDKFTHRIMYCPWHTMMFGTGVAAQILCGTDDLTNLQERWCHRWPVDTSRIKSLHPCQGHPSQRKAVVWSGFSAHVRVNICMDVSLNQYGGNGWCCTGFPVVCARVKSSLKGGATRFLR